MSAVEMPARRSTSRRLVPQASKMPSAVAPYRTARPSDTSPQVRARLCGGVSRLMRLRDEIAHLVHDFAVVGLAEDSGAGDEDVGAGGLYVRDIVELHAAVDLDVDT